MNRTSLAVMVSTLVLVSSVFAGGFAEAQPAPTRIPHIANGTYQFILHANRNLCIVSQGVGNVLKVARVGSHCANIKITGVAHSNQKFFSIGRHCIVTRADHKVRLAQGRCLSTVEYDMWTQYSSGPSTFISFGDSYLGTRYTTGNSMVWSNSASHTNWNLHLTF